MLCAIQFTFWTSPLIWTPTTHTAFNGQFAPQTPTALNSTIPLHGLVPTSLNDKEQLNRNFPYPNVLPLKLLWKMKEYLVKIRNTSLRFCI